MATPPVIGITCAVQQVNDRPSCCLSHVNIDAVLAAGGVPLVLPSHAPEELVPTLLDRLDGLILTGGGDIDAAHFGQERHPQADEPDANRDHFELAAARYAYENRLPTLGYCRGVQVMAVATGGTLWQDIPSQLPGSLTHRYPSDTQSHQFHPVTLLAGSRLAAIMGDETHPVNTFHHQAVQNLGDGLQACAWAPDGVIEAIEAPDRFFLGVQWHPERLANRDQKALALFEALVQAARRPE